MVIEGQSFTDYTARWSQLADGGVQLHRVPGSHLGVLRPPLVAELAEVVEGLIVASES